MSTSQLTIEGIERARENGKKVGRPSDYSKHKEAVKKAVLNNVSGTALADHLDISEATAYRWMEKARSEMSEPPLFNQS